MACNPSVWEAEEFLSLPNPLGKFQTSEQPYLKNKDEPKVVLQILLSHACVCLHTCTITPGFPTARIFKNINLVESYLLPIS